MIVYGGVVDPSPTGQSLRRGLEIYSTIRPRASYGEVIGSSVSRVSSLFLDCCLAPWTLSMSSACIDLGDVGPSQGGGTKLMSRSLRRRG